MLCMRMFINFCVSFVCFCLYTTDLCNYGYLRVACFVWKYLLIFVCFCFVYIPDICIVMDICTLCTFWVSESALETFSSSSSYYTHTQRGHSGVWSTLVYLSFPCPSSPPASVIGSAHLYVWVSWIRHTSVCGFEEFGTLLWGFQEFGTPLYVGFKNSAHLCVWVSRIRHTYVWVSRIRHTSVCGFQEFGTPLCVGFKKTEHFEYNEVLHLFVATIDLLITINGLFFFFFKFL